MGGQSGWNEPATRSETTRLPGSPLLRSHENAACKHRQPGAHRKPDANLSISAGPGHGEDQVARTFSVSTYTRSLYQVERK